MDIRLVSEDADLYKLCREVLEEMGGEPCTLSKISIQEAGTGGDLYIWDYDPNVSDPKQINRIPATHLFVVRRAELASFQEKTKLAQPQILLKPVTRSTLAAFLGLAVSSHTAPLLRADREELLQCLIDTNLKLQEYDQDRTTFLGRAIHDFRSPLTALSGYCGLLLSGSLGPVTAKQAEALGRMQRSVQRLSGLVCAMYELSAGGGVKRSSNLQKGDLRGCVEQALHEIAPLAEEKQITLSLNLETGDQHLYFDAGQIEQLLINILDNACKFTPRSGRIEIRGYPYFWQRRKGNSAMPLNADRRRRQVDGPNSYRIDIRDSGMPIPLERMDRIFEEHVSYVGSSDRAGSGLGLAICRMIASRHNGLVWAENTDFGPMFSLTLPTHHFLQTSEDFGGLKSMEGVGV
jgi:signal transduction histidine kinase